MSVDPISCFVTRPCRPARALALTALGLTLLASPACKKNTPQQVDEPAAEGIAEVDTSAQDDTTPSSQSSVPPYRELELLQAEAEVERLGSEGGVSAFRVGELMVLHKPTPANQIVNAQLYFLGGSQRLSQRTTGIERFALAAAVEGGSTSTPRDAFNAKLDSMGASISAFSGRDDSGVAMQTILPYFDDTWELLVEAMMQPAMPEDTIELERRRIEARIDSRFENPDSQVSYLATQLLFEGHPYAHDQLGTKEVISQVSREELRAWQRHLLEPNQMLLVVVGDVPEQDLIDKVKKSFGRLVSVRAPLGPLPELDGGAADLTFVERDLPTSYIFGLFEAPSFGDPDFAPLVVAIDHLSDRFFEEVRTERNLTYAVSAGLSGHRANYGYFYVTAVDPEATLPVMFEALDEIRTKPLDAQQIKETLNVHITNRYMRQETNAAQASELAYSYFTTGDWRTSQDFVEDLKRVTPEDVQRVTDKYVKDFHFAVVGPDESAIPLDQIER